jgi:hypothetical protein
MIEIFIEDLNQKFTFNEGITLKDILKILMENLRCCWWKTKR